MSCVSINRGSAGIDDSGSPTAPSTTASQAMNMGRDSRDPAKMDVRTWGEAEAGAGECRDRAKAFRVLSGF